MRRLAHHRRCEGGSRSAIAHRSSPKGEEKLCFCLRERQSDDSDIRGKEVRGCLYVYMRWCIGVMVIARVMVMMMPLMTVENLWKTMEITGVTKNLLPNIKICAIMIVVGQARTLTERNITMTLADTINQTRTNIKTIREYLDNLEYNNEANAVTLEQCVKQPLDDIRNAVEFINDYNGITKEMVKVVKDYYGDK